MENTVYDVEIKINPINPPPYIQNYTTILPPSSPPYKENIRTDLCKRDSMYIAKKKSNCLCIRWC